jgi:diguanylate cyclase (GGDEF)-like protein/PAS domain S-box-containing protein
MQRPAQIEGSPCPNKQSAVMLIRASVLLFSSVLSCVFALAVALLFYVSHSLNKAEHEEGIIHIRQALVEQTASAARTAKDYAVWGEAYRNLGLDMDVNWAYFQGNLGMPMFKDFGFEGIFVLDDRNETVYSVINGHLQSVDYMAWATDASTQTLERARKVAGQSAVTDLITVAGAPAIVAAAAIDPGSDPSFSHHVGTHHVLLLVDVLDPDELAGIGENYNLSALRVLQGEDVDSSHVLDLSELGGAGSLHWDPDHPGYYLLSVMLPLLILALGVLSAMTWAIVRRTTQAAVELDQNFEDLVASKCALRASEERFRDVAESCSDWIWEIDSSHRFTYLSERFAAVTRHPSVAWLGVSMSIFLQAEGITLSHWLGGIGRRSNVSLQCRFVDNLGRTRIARISARPLSDGGFRGTASDITEEVEAQKRVEYLSQHDALTGLPNRTRLQEFLEGKLKAIPTAESPLVMLCIDLDRFKPVNDLLGHASGDLVLNEVSERLTKCVRSEDLVARVGGDEFVMIVTGICDQAEIELLCRRVIASVEQPFEIQDQTVFIGASIGIAMAPLDASEAAELLRYADIALYEAKAQGRNTWRFYSQDMNSRIVERRQTELDLRDGIKLGQLRLHFQPRYRLSDNQMAGVEALVRWEHPVRGLVPPDTFISVAEETGLIIPLTNWVLRSACQAAEKWPDHLYVSVNLSSIDFKHGDLCERIQQVLVESGLNPSRLELELTESVMLEDAEGALQVMGALKKLGVRLSMDDFGTGYSSLSYLREFPFDGIKIDRSFISRVTQSPDDHAIVQAIVALDSSLSLTVTAEGIETEEQVHLLRQMNCDEGQGFFLGRPLETEKIEKLFHQK